MTVQSVSNRLLLAGIIGILITAVCAFTPVLVWVLVALGLAAFVQNWLDLILYPILALFVCLTIFALLRRAAPKDAKQTPARRRVGTK